MTMTNATVSQSRLAQCLLRPKSIALIGASDDMTKNGGRPLLYLRRAGYQGAVYPINPRRESVQDEKAWPSIAALPEVPDIAYIVSPTESVLAAVEECAAAGVPVVGILASGFSEAGEDGAAREAQLKAIGERTGIRIVGPSCIGIVNLHQRLLLTANAAFAEAELPVGNIFVASHSGSMIGALMSRGKGRGIGFAGLVSVGNEIDLSVGEICMHTLDDPTIHGYMLFLETSRNSTQLREFALAAAERGKPVVAYKLGRSAAAAELAVSHTGALAGEDDVADIFLKACGIARVETLDGLIESLPLLARVPMKPGPARRPRVGVVTTTGGGAAMVVDQLGIRQIDVQAPSAETFSRLAAAGVEVSHGRIVDLTLAGVRYPIMKAALDVLLSAPEFDLIVAVIGSSARFQPELAVRPVVDCSHAATPLAAFVVPEAPEALHLMTVAGVPSFRSPESCADAIASAFARRFPEPLAAVARRPQAGGRMLDEAQAYALLEQLGVPHAPVTIISPDARVPPDQIRYPAVAKVLSADIAHKSDIGGVALNLQNDLELAAAAARIRTSVANHRPDVVVDKILVQPMIQGLGEVLLGYRHDSEAGPLVMLAAGGVLTELYRDRSLRLAPVDVDTAREMIGEVKALRALAGYRGRPAGDLEALAHAVSSFSQLAVRGDVFVAEAEINPLLVMPSGNGVVAVDALVRLA
jgi:acyl-CoA synthetase (NDP forming)